jgi:hypothetical protein
MATATLRRGSLMPLDIHIRPEVWGEHSPLTLPDFPWASIVSHTPTVPPKSEPTTLIQDQKSAWDRFWGWIGRPDKFWSDVFGIKVDPGGYILDKPAQAITEFFKDKALYGLFGLLLLIGILALVWPTAKTVITTAAKDAAKAGV